MRELARAGLGEEDAVIGAQAAGLALEVRSLQDVAACFVDEAIPHVHIGDAGAPGGVAIQRIQKQRVRRRLGAADRRQADPEHRHALRFQDGDHLVDLLGVKLGPALVVERMHALRCTAALRRHDRRPVVIVIGGVRRPVGRRSRLVVRLGVRVLLVGFLFRGRFADRHAVVQAEHHDDGFRLLVGENFFGRRGPIRRLALRLVT